MHCLTTFDHCNPVLGSLTASSSLWSSYLWSSLSFSNVVVFFFFFFLQNLKCVQGLAKQLAQVLLRGVCERSYEKPLNLLPSSPLISSTSSLKSGSKMDLKATSSNVITCKHATFPLKPQMYNGERYEMSLSVPLFFLRPSSWSESFTEILPMVRFDLKTKWFYHFHLKVHLKLWHGLCLRVHRVT